MPTQGPGSVRANPIRTRKDWEAAREAASRDPGAFHGDIARRELFWFDGAAWVKRVDGAAPWLGFDATTGARLAEVKHAPDWAPWTRAFDDSEAPFYRWFAGGLTNACFNEVDVHVVPGMWANRHAETGSGGGDSAPFGNATTHRRVRL